MDANIIKAAVSQLETRQNQSLQELTLAQNKQALRNGEVSIYCMDAPATIDEVRQEIGRLITIYANRDNRTGRIGSKQSDEFWLELANMVLEAGWSARQLHEAISRHLTTCEYQTFTIGNIMNYHKNIKTYTNDEIYVRTGQFPHPDYVKVITSVDHMIVNVSIEDYNRYKYSEKELDMIRKSGGVVHRFGFVKFDPTNKSHRELLKK